MHVLVAADPDSSVGQDVMTWHWSGVKISVSRLGCRGKGDLAPGRPLGDGLWRRDEIVNQRRSCYPKAKTAGEATCRHRQERRGNRRGESWRERTQVETPLVHRQAVINRTRHKFDSESERI